METQRTDYSVVQFSIQDTIISTGWQDSRISTISDIATYNDDIYLLDSPEGRILKIDASTGESTIIGRRGCGPGEFGYPVSIAVSSDSCLYVSDNGKKTLFRYEVNGEFCEDILYYSGDPFLDLDASCNSVAVALSISFLGIEESGFLVETSLIAFSHESDCLGIILADTCIIDPTTSSEFFNKTLFAYHFAAGGDRCFVYDRSCPEYLIQCIPLAGDSLYSISQEYDPVYKSQEEISWESEFITDYLNGLGGSDVIEHDYTPRPWKEPVAGLWVADDSNHLWVQRGDLNGVNFDVFDIDSSELLYRASLSDIGNDVYSSAVHVADDEAVYLLVENESCIQHLIILDRVGPILPHVE